MASPVQARSTLCYPLPLPKTHLDPISVVALFALYNVLGENDRFGIYKHSIVYQPSSPTHVPLISHLVGMLDYQTLQRTINGDGRSDACTFEIAIEEALINYLLLTPFQKILPILEKGLKKYVGLYPVADNSSTTFNLGITRVQEAVQNQKNPNEFVGKYCQQNVNDLKRNKAKVYASWTEPEIAHIFGAIYLAYSKQQEGKSCVPEIKSVLSYLAEKQFEILNELEAAQKSNPSLPL